MYEQQWKLVVNEAMQTQLKVVYKSIQKLNYTENQVNKMVIEHIKNAQKSGTQKSKNEKNVVNIVCHYNRL